MKLRTLLELGRTSNLPTIWSNVLCGGVLSGAALGPTALGVLIIAGSALYEGGMLLNDAFDADIDREERPERPIPSGRASRRTVYELGFGLLLSGVAVIAAAAYFSLSAGFGAVVAGVLTAACVLVYDKWHKGHAWAPVVMGMCRAGLYLTAALAVAGSGSLSPAVLVAAGALLLYVVGLTHIARFETGAAVDRAWVSAFVFSPLVVAVAFLVERGRSIGLIAGGCLLLLLGWTIRAVRIALRGGPGSIPRAVVSLIAGVSLVDATFIACAGSPLAALAALCAFALTLRWQRRIRGT